MKLVTWNVNSLKARGEHVAAYLDRVSPTVLCLQELKQPTEDVDRSIFHRRGYHVEVHGQRTYNGVAIASKYPLTDVVHGIETIEQGQARYIAATVAGLRIVNLYCPQGRAVDHEFFQYKLSFYEALIEHLKADYTPLTLVTGDLNVAPQKDDVWDEVHWAGRCSFTPEEHALWARLLDVGFVDAAKPYLDEKTFSFWDYRARSFQRGLGLRIDHWLVSPQLYGQVQGAGVDQDERGRERASDHAPVELDLAWS